MNVVVKLAPDGSMTTVAGGGAVSGNTLGWTGISISACVDDLSGDGSPATQTGLCTVGALAVDASGNLFVGEQFYFDPADDNAAWALRKVSPDGIITTAAGNTHGWASDGSLATSGMIASGGTLAVDGAGSIFITDGASIRKITPDGIINSVAGRIGDNDPIWFANQHFSGDGGPATSATLFRPYSVAVDWSGNLFIADENKRVRKVTLDGTISTVAGGGTLARESADGGPATSALLSLSSYSSFGIGNGVLAADGGGNLFILDRNGLDGDRIRRVSTDGIITTVAGGGTLEGTAANGHSAATAHLVDVSGIAADFNGNIFIAEHSAQRVRKITADGIISSFAGTGVQGPSGDGGLALRAQLAYPFAVAVDNTGNVFIADGFSQHIRQVTEDGIIHTFAGNGKPGIAGGAPPATGDGGPATGAPLAMDAIAADGMGSLFVASGGIPGIRQITPDGIINTVAGSNQPFGAFGYSGDGGPATQATLGSTSSVAADRTGNVYIADTVNNVVRVLRPANSSGN